MFGPAKAKCCSVLQRQSVVRSCKGKATAKQRHTMKDTIISVIVAGMLLIASAMPKYEVTFVLHSVRYAVQVSAQSAYDADQLVKKQYPGCEIQKTEKVSAKQSTAKAR